MKNRAATALPSAATFSTIVRCAVAIVPAGTNGAVSIYVTNTTNVILDINGYFAPPSGSTLAFYPLTPCRVLDTRNPNGPLDRKSTRLNSSHLGISYAVF